MEKIYWLKKPEKHDYPAAASYLKLLFSSKLVKKMVKGLEKAEMSEFKAKDIFRASNLSLLGISNSHVTKNKTKIDAGKKLSPLLLVADKKLGKVIIADGYHRMCTIYGIDEDAVIPCKIVYNE